MPFRHRDDVGNHALRFKAPEMRAGAAEAGLHFVGDAHAAGGADVFVSVLEIAVRKYHEAADALDGFGDEAGDLARRGEVDHLLHVVRVFLAGVRIVVAERSAIRIRRDARDARRSCAAR